MASFGWFSSGLWFSGGFLQFFFLFSGFLLFFGLGTVSGQLDS